MKHFTWIVAVGLFLAASTGSHASLINGDFSGGTAGTWAPGAAEGASNAVPTGWLGFDTADGSLRVPSNNVVFNAANKPAGSWIQQTVPVQTGKWYTLQWDHQDGPGGHPDRAVSTGQVWDGATAAGTPDLADRAVRYPTSGIQHVLQSATGQVTARLGDAGSNSTSNDTQIDNASLELSNGMINIAPIGVADALSHHGSFGVNPQSAVDGSSNYGDGRTNFHSAGQANEWWNLTFDDPVRLQELQIQARSGFNSRNGDFLDLLNSSGGVIDTLSIANGALWTATGNWLGVSEIVVRNSSTATVPLNLAEVRAFAEFENGVMTIPEPTTILIWSLLAGLAMSVGWRQRK